MVLLILQGLYPAQRDLKVTNASGAEIPTVDLGTVSTTGTPASVQFKLVPSDNACLAKMEPRLAGHQII